MYKRHRKLRNSSAIRNLVKNIYLEKGDLIYPIFIEEGENVKRKIGGITGDTMGASLELTAILVLFAGIILK